MPSAAHMVFDCIQRFGDASSNPVLEVLKDVPDFAQGQKYPQPALAFAAGCWRTYYHSHPLTGGGAEEHGHFHLFVQHDDAADEPAWTHLAALAMDRDGQPLRWFATNRWVTGGQWGEHDRLLSAVDALAPMSEQGILQQWLVAMVQLYRAELDALLCSRDAQLAGRLCACPAEQVLADRSLYELAQSPIDLRSKLTSQLRGEIV
jgi:hypothetical protein